mgnify:CR=1 FL=1
MTAQTLTITQPDDWHVHLRDGEMLKQVAGYTARQFGRAIIMPNLATPVTTTAMADAYRQRILEATQTYPDFQIDAEKEKELLLCHDILVFVFPIYWYSSPSLLKEWQDCVLEYGFAYGSKGNKLHGKTLLCMTSTGSPLSAYQADDSQESIMKALLMPIEKMAQDTRLNYLEPITLYDSRTAVEEDRLAPHVTYCMDKINALLSEE